MNTIYATFADPSQAEKAVGALLDHGVRAEDISVVRSHSGDPDVADPTRPTAGLHSTPAEDENLARHPDAGGVSRVTMSNVDESGDVEATAKQGITTTTPADAGAGAIKGTAWGLGIGAVAALASLVVPGVGLVVGGGALAAALGGVAATAGAGAAAGALTGYLKDQGVEDDSAATYERSISGGGALLAVSTPSGDVAEDDVRDIVQKYGGSDMNAYASRRPGYVA